MLTHESARGRRFQGLNVRHSECAAEVLITQMPRSAGASCRDAATAVFFWVMYRMHRLGAEDAFSRFPFDHSNVTLQLHFPGSSNRTVSIS